MATADLLPAMALHLVEPSGSTGLRLRPMGEVTGTVGKPFHYPASGNGTDNGAGAYKEAMKSSEQVVVIDHRMNYSSVTRIYAAVAFSFLGLAVLLSMMSFVPGLGALKVAVGMSALIASFSGVRFSRLANHDRRRSY